MKKLIISSVLGLALAASTAFGQGYINFGGGLRSVWDDTTAPTIDTTFDVTFLWSATSSTSPLGTAIATNDTALVNASAEWATISNSAAGGNGWTVATTGGANVYGTATSAVGAWAAGGGAAFALDGGTSSGEAISIVAVAWETDGGLYNTLAAAESGDANIGWSSVFSYTLGSGPPATPPAETVTPHFGIAPSPEPTTLALAGLGGLSMLFLRRKKA